MQFVSLGMFIIDEFEYLDERGEETGEKQRPQVSNKNNCQ